MSDFQSLVKSDDQYKRYKKILATVKGALDLTATGKEAAWLHSQRMVRKLHELRVSPVKLQDALMQELSNRARLIELKSLVIDQKDLLESAISLCKKHLRGTYSSELNDLAPTAVAKTDVMDRIFASGKDYLSQVESLNTKLDLFIKDIDAAGYALTNARELLKLVLDRKEVV